MKCWAVEGNRQRLDGGAMFGNAPKELWQRWAAADDENRILLATRALLVQDGAGAYHLFETGVGAFFDSKMRQRYGIVEEGHCLLENLEKIGVAHEKIASVILSHLHFDHAGGLLTAYDGGDPSLLFPNARYYVGARHWQNACRPHIRERASFIPLIQELLEKSGRLVLVEDVEEIESLPLPHTLHFVEGHTVGMMLTELKMDSEMIFFVSDLAPGAAWVHLPLTMGYDRCAETVVNEKDALFTEIAAGGAKVFFTHDPEMVIGTLERGENGRFSVRPVVL